MINDLRQPAAVKSLELWSLLELKRLMMDDGPVKLVTASGEPAELPSPLRTLMIQVVEQTTEGRAVLLTRGEKLVTTQQGAAMLGISRPSFIKLLEQGEMPHHRVGNQRRVRVSDLLDYLQRHGGDRWVARVELDMLLEHVEKSGRSLEWTVPKEISE
jgi:excisionase family DNA binding protein